MDTKTHQQIRFETATEMAETAKDLKGDELRDYLEQILLTGEKRGLAASIEFLKFQEEELRKRSTNGVANHVRQAIVSLYNWAVNSENFTLYVRPPGKPAPRKFFGMGEKKNVQ